MNGKVGPIPTVIIFLVFAIALLIDLPMVLLHTSVQSHLNRQDTVLETSVLENKKAEVTPVASPTATMTPTPTPIRRSSTIRVIATPTVAPTK